MTINTTPETIQPGELQAYDARDFSTIVVGGGPDGRDCLRLNQESGSNAQSLWQPLRTDSHLWPAYPEENALSFWINRRGSFVGTGLSSGYESVATLPGDGGLIMGLGGASATTVIDGGDLHWGVIGSNTNDLHFVTRYMSGGQSIWYTLALDVNLALDAWTHFVVNLGSFNAGLGSWTPAQSATEIFMNGQMIITTTLPQSSSSGGTWARMQAVTADVISVTRFAIGDPTLTAAAIQASSPGPICDLSDISFHSRRLTHLEVLNLYEAMLYGA